MMKRMLLIGDSIRLGYQPVVADRLAGMYRVSGPAINCGPSQHLVEHLDSWVLSQPADVIHLNVGLHDLKLEYYADHRLTALERYRRNLERILHRIVSASRAQVVWATTTPIHQRWCRPSPELGRPLVHVPTYNAAALEIVKRFGLAVNDLYQVVIAAGPERLWHSDGVHFNTDGYALLGEAVARFVGGLEANGQ